MCSDGLSLASDATVITGWFFNSSALSSAARWVEKAIRAIKKFLIFGSTWLIVLSQQVVQ